MKSRFLADDLHIQDSHVPGKLLKPGKVLEKGKTGKCPGKILEILKNIYEIIILYFSQL